MAQEGGRETGPGKVLRGRKEAAQSCGFAEGGSGLLGVRAGINTAGGRSLPTGMAACKPCHVVQLPDQG